MITDVVDKWEKERAKLLNLHALVDAAALIDEFLRDLSALGAEEKPCPLQTASLETGYSADHLARLIRCGKLTNYGRKHAPRVRLSECPQKVRPLAQNGDQPYNPLTDARSLRVRR